MGVTVDKKGGGNVARKAPLLLLLTLGILTSGKMLCAAMDIETDAFPLEMPCDVNSTEAEFTENLLCLFDYGDEHIEYPTEDSNVILVVGRSGAGKSTLAQVMAKSCDKMDVICNPLSGSCIIRDPDGFASNETIISETFLPNRIENLDNNHDAVFYDCPGFEDTRGALIDIANAYYMTELANKSKNVKLLIVSLYSAFDGSIRDMFTDLLRSLSGYMLDPADFFGSLAMIANRAPGPESDPTDAQIVYKIKEFMNTVRGDLDKLNWPPDVLAKSKLILEDLVDRIGGFRVPSPSTKNGSLCDYPNLVNSRYSALSLIHDNTNYSFSNQIRFKMHLTPESVLKLTEVIQDLIARLVVIVPRISSKIVEDFRDTLRKYLSDEPVDIEALAKATKAMAEAIYPASPLTENSSVEQWFNTIKQILLTFANSPDTEEDITDMVKLGGYIDKLFALHPNLTQFINPDPFVVWKQSFESIRTTLVSDGMTVLQDLISRLDVRVPRLSSNIVEDFSDIFRKYLNNQSVDTDALELATKAMAEANYPSSPLTGGSSVEQWFNTVKQILLTFVTDDGSDIGEMVHLGGKIHTLFTLYPDLTQSVSPDPFLGWKHSFESMKPTLAFNATTILQDTIMTSLQNNSAVACIEAANTITTTVSAMNASVDDQLYQLSQYSAKGSTLKQTIGNYVRDSQSTFYGLTDLMYTGIKDISMVPTEIVEKILQHQGITKAIENLVALPIHNYDWEGTTEEYVTRLLNDDRFLRFLNVLFIELSSPTIQIDDLHQLRHWKSLFGTINSSNFAEFWDKFTKAWVAAVINEKMSEALQYFSTHPNGFKGLNTAVDYTIGGGDACPVNTGGTLTFSRNYIKISHVKTCVEDAIGVVSRVIVLAGNTLFFDINWGVSSSIPNRIKLFVIAPRWEGRGTVHGVDLSGNPGAPPSPLKIPGKGGATGAAGNHGMPASDFVGVYQDRLGISPEPNPCGGLGGTGQGGQDGLDGQPGSAPHLNEDSDDWIPQTRCASWSGGEIQIRMYKNSCNRLTGGDGCTAGNSGKWVALWGDGSSGTPGGAGGQGGTGGPGGSRVMYNVSTSSGPVTTSYTDGTAGQSGSRGTNGIDGSTPGLCVRIDDVLQSIGNKRCKLLEYGSMTGECNGFNPLTLSRSPQTENHIARQTTCTGTPTEQYPIAEFKPYAVQFKNTAVLYSNPFSFVRVTNFVDLLGKNTPF